MGCVRVGRVARVGGEACLEANPIAQLGGWGSLGCGPGFIHCTACATVEDVQYKLVGEAAERHGYPGARWDDGASRSAVDASLRSLDGHGRKTRDRITAVFVENEGKWERLTRWWAGDRRLATRSTPSLAPQPFPPASAELTTSAYRNSMLIVMGINMVLMLPSVFFMKARLPPRTPPPFSDMKKPWKDVRYTFLVAGAMMYGMK